MQSDTNKSKSFGFIRCATAAPRINVANIDANVEAILQSLRRAESQFVDVLCLPELSLCGYTCGDLFHQTQLLDDCLAGLSRLSTESAKLFNGTFVVGAPLSQDGKLYNCGVVICKGRMIGVVSKTHLPNYKEFYERRWFAPSSSQRRLISVCGEEVPFGQRLIFQSDKEELFRFCVEICEDLWMPIPESSYSSLAGALLTLNLSASNEVAGKAEYRRTLVQSQSGRCLGAYAYAGAGSYESTTDLVFGGHCMIAENGVLVGEVKPFAEAEPFLFCDIDLEKLHHERMRTGSFYDAGVSDKTEEATKIQFSGREKNAAKSHDLFPKPDGNPYLPSDKDVRQRRCQEVFTCQAIGLQVRLAHLFKASAKAPCTIGVSGGLDSTLALLVTARALDSLKLSRSLVKAFTLPGFGTSERTFKNAHLLMQALGFTFEEIDIKPLAYAEMRSIHHKPFGLDISTLSLDEFIEALSKLPPEKRSDLTFENVQARARTSILMNQGFVIGTGDLSEIALGWSTYNADHMSMYNPNAGVPKTLVHHLVAWAAEQEFGRSIKNVLKDVLATEISPELLPLGKDGVLAQLTESVVGPYELHDFFLFYFVRYGFSPEKILFLAEQAVFTKPYDRKTITRWLKVFLTRFFANQYKRSASPDGPKVGSVSLSPRGDWRMPSDAASQAWLDGLE